MDYPVNQMTRLVLTKDNQRKALKSLGQDPGSDWTKYPDMLRAVGSGNYQDSKEVTPDPAGMTITPDESYDGMLEVILKGDPNFQPWNIVSGIEAWGVTGSAKYKVSTEFPTNLPITEEEADAAVLAEDPEAPVDDKFVMVDNNGDIIVGYMYTPANNIPEGAPPELPDYDEATYPYVYLELFENEYYFVQCTTPLIYDGDSSYVTSADCEIHIQKYSNDTWERDDHYTEESGKAVSGSEDVVWSNENILDGSGKVYFKGSDYGTGSRMMVYNGHVLPALPEWDKETYPYAVITRYKDGYTFNGKDFTGCYCLDFFSDEHVANTQSDGRIVPKTTSGTSYLHYSYYPNEHTSWVSSSGNPLYAYTALGVGSIIWVNYDMRLEETGEIHISASEPIPHGGFEITRYDPATTNFKAVGWRRVSKHTTGELAGQITTDDFTWQESDGWNYLRNIRSCTREKLYYQGVEVWPNSQYATTLWPDVADKVPQLPAYDSSVYQCALITGVVYSSTIELRLYCFTVPVFNNDAGYIADFIAKEAGSGICYSAYVDPAGAQEGDVWERFTDGDVDIAPDTRFMIVNGGAVRWANFEILNYSDNTGYFPKCDAIPV